MTMDYRSLARGLALQILYELDTTVHSLDQVLNTYANMAIPADDARVTAYMVLRSCFDESLPLLELDNDDDWYVLDNPDMRPENTLYKMVSQIVRGVDKNRQLLDDLIVQYATERPSNQLPTIDRNILRIAIYEMLLLDMRTPVRVAVNEAVELAKLFGSETTFRFINGVLATVVENRRELQEILALISDET